MLFKPEHKDMILNGTKTATRRNWKKPMVKVGGVYKCKTKLFSKDYFALIKVTKLYKQQIIDMSFDDVKKEGYKTIEEFEEVFKRVNKIKGYLDTDIELDVVEFRLINEETNKTILFGLQLERENLKKKLKTAEGRVRKTNDTSVKYIAEDCKRIDIAEKLDEVEEQIKDYGGDLKD